MLILVSKRKRTKKTVQKDKTKLQNSGNPISKKRFLSGLGLYNIQLHFIAKRHVPTPQRTLQPIKVNFISMGLHCPVCDHHNLFENWPLHSWSAWLNPFQHSGFRVPPHANKTPSTKRALEEQVFKCFLNIMCAQNIIIGVNCE